jgi:hypothetical protein
MQAIHLVTIVFHQSAALLSSYKWRCPRSCTDSFLEASGGILGIGAFNKEDNINPAATWKIE